MIPAGDLELPVPDEHKQMRNSDHRKDFLLRCAAAVSRAAFVAALDLSADSGVRFTL
jgi:hypothetical protein